MKRAGKYAVRRWRSQFRRLLRFAGHQQCNLVNHRATDESRSSSPEAHTYHKPPGARVLLPQRTRLALFGEFTLRLRTYLRKFM